MIHIRSNPARVGTRAVTASALLIAASWQAAPALAQGVGYTLVPTATSVQWDKALALDEDVFYGVRLGILFGSRVELQPFYYRRSGLGLDSARSMAVHGFEAAGRSLDVRHAGANVQVNLGDGSLFPFVRVGGGVLRLDPDSGERRERVAVNAGAGVRFSLGGMQGELFAEQSAFRLAPARLFSTAVTDPPPESVEQRNVIYGAALSIPLTSMPNSSRPNGLWSATAPLEPFVGRLRYSGDVGLPDQELAGIRAGLDFTPLVGIRGFWWRGVNEDRDGTEPVAGYGGEAQFNLSSSPGVTPYIVAGAGRLHYSESFRDPDGASRVDQTALILGGGVSLILSDRVRLNIGARDYILTLARSLSDAEEVDDLLHNTLVSAGFTLNLGGRDPSPGVRRAGAESGTELERLRAENARLLAERAAQRADTAEVTSRRVDTAAVLDTGGVGETGRLITVPVPERGEIILRYGITSDSSRVAAELANVEAIRRVIREQLGADTLLLRTTAERLDSTAFELRLRLLEGRILSRVEEIVETRMRARQEPEPPVVVVTAPSDTMTLGAVGRSFFSRLADVRANDIRPRTGVQVSDDVQFVLGARADLGPVSPTSDLRLVPEVALGVGEGTVTLLALANVQYPFFTSGAPSSFQPYVMGGIGLYSRTLIAVNTALGASLDLRAGRGAPLYGFIELQGINLFDHTRVMFGLSSRR